MNYMVKLEWQSPLCGIFLSLLCTLFTASISLSLMSHIKEMSAQWYIASLLFVLFYSDPACIYTSDLSELRA